MGQSTSRSSLLQHIHEGRHREGVFFSRVPSGARNIVMFGEADVEKSSLISMLSDYNRDGDSTRASNHSDRKAFTTSCSRVTVDNVEYALWETAGLNEGDLYSPSQIEDALDHLPDLLLQLSSGIGLLIYCIRASRYRETHKVNYDLFTRIIFREIPVVVIITGLENEQPSMSGWWSVNKKHYEKQGMKFAGSACVTTRKDEIFRHRYDESRKAIRELIKKHCPQDTGWTVVSDIWLERVMAEIEIYYRPLEVGGNPPSAGVGSPIPRREATTPLASSSTNSIPPRRLDRPSARTLSTHEHETQSYVEAALQALPRGPSDPIAAQVGHGDPLLKYDSQSSAMSPHPKSSAAENMDGLSTAIQKPVPINGNPSTEIEYAALDIPAVNPSHSLPTLLDIITKIVNDSASYKTLLEAKGQEAETILDMLQKALDYLDISEQLRPSLVKTMIRLSKASGTYPQCLTLKGIERETYPVAEGAFGEIYKGMYGQYPVCLKVPRTYASPNTRRFTTSFMREAIVWCQLSHPNVLPFYGVYHLDERIPRLCLVSPWMEEGNICAYLEREPMTPRLPLVFDVLDGLSYLHRGSIIHSDLKGLNVLITSAGSACLADFGLSSIDDPGFSQRHASTVTQFGGTTRWLAPELLNDTKDGGLPRPSYKSDVYSAACVMYEILFGQIPFYEVKLDATVIQKIMQGHKPTGPSPSLSETLELTDDIWGIMLRCWSSYPNARPTVDGVIQALRQILPSKLTLQRIAARYCSRPQGTTAWHPGMGSAWMVRAAKRGQEAALSEAEVAVLRELAVI